VHVELAVLPVSTAATKVDIVNGFLTSVGVPTAGLETKHVIDNARAKKVTFVR
jgi:hypothetical protein